jgi:hypothetical protein
MNMALVARAMTGNVIVTRSGGGLGELFVPMGQLLRIVVIICIEGNHRWSRRIFWQLVQQFSLQKSVIALFVVEWYSALVCQTPPTFSPVYLTFSFFR